MCKTPTGAIAALIASLFPVAAAHAVPLRPGERADTFEAGFGGDGGGPVVATRSTPFRLTGEHDEDPNIDLVVTGTLVNTVYRNPDTGYLSFRYVVDASTNSYQYGIETDLEWISARGFGSFETDVVVESSHHWGGISRSPNGDAINLGYNAADSDGDLTVYTNATQFNDGGSFSYQVSFQADYGDDAVRIPTFRPVVPEPAGAALLLGAGAAGRLTRRPRRPRISR